MQNNFYKLTWQCSLLWLGYMSAFRALIYKVKRLAEDRQKCGKIALWLRWITSVSCGSFCLVLPIVECNLKSLYPILQWYDNDEKAYRSIRFCSVSQVLNNRHRVKKPGSTFHDIDTWPEHPTRPKLLDLRSERSGSISASKSDGHQRLMLTKKLKPYPNEVAEVSVHCGHNN